MKCPRCDGSMIVMENGSVKIDVCYESCGGIWFDWMELRKMDEAHEADPEFINKLSKSANKKFDLAEKILCPKCDNQPMMRRFSSIKRAIEVDECPICSGFWLDAGELIGIHSEFKTDEDRKVATEQFINDTFGKEIELLQMKSNERAEKAQKFARALRFICPSNYIPGKQRGGAF